MRKFWYLAVLVLTACGTDTGGPGEPLRLVSASLPPAAIGDTYSARFLAEGGVRPYTFKLDGALPKGLSFASGSLAGTPQEKGLFSLVLTVEDAALSSRAQKVVLNVTDPPPPTMKTVQPLSPVSEAFFFAARAEGRETKGFQAQFSLKDLEPVLDTLKAADGLLYVLRFDRAKAVFDIDAVFVGSAKKDIEVFRLTLTPTAKEPVRTNIQPKVIFLDKTGKAFAPAPLIERTKTDGKYTYADLLLLAETLSSKPQPAGGDKAPPSPGGEGKTDQPADAPRTPLKGDFNQDGVVNMADLEALRSSYAWGNAGTVQTEESPKPSEERPAETPPADGRNGK